MLVEVHSENKVGVWASPVGVAARVLALIAAIWPNHNHHSGWPHVHSSPTTTNPRN